MGGGLVALLALATGASCNKPQTAAETDEQIATRARASLAPFKTKLREALVSSMADGGPEASIDVCGVIAPKLASEASTGGVRMGRAADKRRNQKNTAPPWAAPLMADLAREPKDAAFKVARLDEGRVGYVETILTQPLCLTCHGDTIAPNVAARINERYPNDKATKFHAGDFRGVFWIELPRP